MIFIKFIFKTRVYSQRAETSFNSSVSFCSKEICNSGGTYLMCPLCNTCKAWNMSEICTMAKVGEPRPLQPVHRELSPELMKEYVVLSVLVGRLATCLTTRAPSSSASSCPSGPLPSWSTGRERWPHWLTTGTAWTSMKKRSYTFKSLAAFPSQFCP